MTVRSAPKESARPGSRGPGWSLSDLAAGLGAVVLAIALFLPWFGVAIGPVGVTVTGVEQHDYLYVVLALCIVELVYLVATARWAGVAERIPVHREALLAEINVLNLAIVVAAFFDTGGGGAGWRYGAVVALVAAGVAALTKLATVISPLSRR